MKKLIYLSAATLTVAIQGVAFAQTNQGSPVNRQEYNIVVSAVCETEGDVAEVKDAVASMARRSISSRKIRKLQEIAVQMLSLPEIEQERICME